MQAFSIGPRDWSNELSIPNAVAAIREAFPLTAIDAEQGRQRAQQVLDRLRSMDAPSAVQDVYVKGGTEAVMVDLGETASLPFMLMPGEGIHVRCSETAIAHKLAKALDYECLKIG